MDCLSTITEGKANYWYRVVGMVKGAGASSFCLCLFSQGNEGTLIHHLVREEVGGHVE